jgi:hypothetical protein
LSGQFLSDMSDTCHNLFFIMTCENNDYRSCFHYGPFLCAAAVKGRFKASATFQLIFFVLLAASKKVYWEAQHSEHMEPLPPDFLWIFIEPNKELSDSNSRGGKMSLWAEFCIWIRKQKPNCSSRGRQGLGGKNLPTYVRLTAELRTFIPLLTDVQLQQPAATQFGC